MTIVPLLLPRVAQASDERDAAPIPKKTEVCLSCRHLLQPQMDELARQMQHDKELYNNVRAERDRLQQMYLKRVEADGQRIPSNGGTVDEADLPAFFSHASALVVKRINDLEAAQRRDAGEIEALKEQVLGRLRLIHCLALPRPNACCQVYSFYF